jgi:UDP-N-acetyl-D-mannosaminuronic acid transferase (WecB/TagA/CpsF family)
MFRIAQEPRRLTKRYLESNSRFAAMVIGEELGLTRPHGDVQ